MTETLNCHRKKYEMESHTEAVISVRSEIYVNCLLLTKEFVLLKQFITRACVCVWCKILISYKLIYLMTLKIHLHFRAI